MSLSFGWKKSGPVVPSIPLQALSTELSFWVLPYSAACECSDITLRHFFCQWFNGNTTVAVCIPLCQLYHKYGETHESHVRYFYPLSPSGRCGNFCFQILFEFLFSTFVFVFSVTPAWMAFMNIFSTQMKFIKKRKKKKWRERSR